jgi:hypothetical protein
VRDTEVLEFAAAFLEGGPDEQPGVDHPDELVDVIAEVQFGERYTLDQVAATLDSLDGLLTAGLIAAEARATGDDPASILEQCVSRAELEIVWEIEYTEAGSLRLRARIKRVGRWVSNHKGLTLWLIAGVGAVAAPLGLPVYVPVIVWAVGGAVQAAIDKYEADHRLGRTQVTGPSDGRAPMPEVRLDVAPTT